MPGRRPEPGGDHPGPRERMVGHGIASSLVHEVGHQGAAMLELVDSLRRRPGPAAPALRRSARRSGGRSTSGSPRSSRTCGPWRPSASRRPWACWPWSACRGSSCSGRPGDDPHPMPVHPGAAELRASVSALYPHPQWAHMASHLEGALPRRPLPADRQQEFALFEAEIRPSSGRSSRTGRRPSAAAACASPSRPGASAGAAARAAPRLGRGPRRHGAAAAEPGLRRRRPGRAAGRITPEAESDLIGALLRAWALRSSLAITEHVTTTRRALARA